MSVTNTHQLVLVAMNWCVSAAVLGDEGWAEVVASTSLYVRTGSVRKEHKPFNSVLYYHM